MYIFVGYVRRVCVCVCVCVSPTNIFKLVFALIMQE